LRAEIDIFKSDFMIMVERQLFKEGLNTKTKK
jgi:hypothetical protein